MTMADLLAKQSTSGRIKLATRGQEVEGKIVAILSDSLILDLGTKSEGVLSKKDLPVDQLEGLKIGDKLTTFVTYPENDSGQVVLGLQKMTFREGTNGARFERFNNAQRTNQILTGKVLEVNKGGLVIDLGGTRGFLPTSQLALSQAQNPEELVGQEVKVRVIEVDFSQNRLILTQVIEISEELKTKLAAVKIGDSVEGKISSILSFGLVIKLAGELEGFVHISESAWEKVEDLNSAFKIGDALKAKVVSVDQATARVNLSIKQVGEDPFSKLAEKFQTDDVVSGEVTKVDEKGVFLSLGPGIEGFIPSSRLEKEIQYLPGVKLSCIVDSVDAQRRRVNLAPFITSTKDLIYK